MTRIMEKGRVGKISYPDKNIQKTKIQNVSLSNPTDKPVLTVFQKLKF